MADKAIPFKIKPFLQNAKVADAVDIEINASGFDGNLDSNTTNVQALAQAVDDLTTSGGGTDDQTAAEVTQDSSNQNGLINNAPNVQAALDRIDATGLGASPRTFTDSFIASWGTLGNQDVWYGGRQTVYLIGESSSNGNRVFELPDITELTNMFDDLVTRGLGEIFTITIEFDGGTSSSVSRNSLTVRAPSVSALFDRNEIPVTITRGAFVTFRITRTGSTINQWERVFVGQSRDPVATFGEVVIQTTSWNNADSSLLPSGGAVQKGYAFPVFGSNPNDGTLRQGLLDGGVSDRVIYNGDYVIWTADTFTSWLDGDNWFVLNRDSLQRISREFSNFLSQVVETDTRIDLGNIQALGANHGLIWLSPVVMNNAPFLDPNTDSNNPRANASGVRYVGGTLNRDAQNFFEYGANFFNAYLYIGITPSYVNNEGAANIDIVTYNLDGEIIHRFNLATDFTQLTDSDFTNSTVNHYIYNTSGSPSGATTFNYPSLSRIGVILTQNQRRFTLRSPDVDVTDNVRDLQKEQLEQEVRDLLDKIEHINPNPNPDFSSIENRLLTLTNVQVKHPYTNTYYADVPTTGAYPNNVANLNRVNPENPQFRVNASSTSIFIYVESGNLYTVSNITQSSEFPLDRGIPNVDLGISLQIDGATYFGYRVDGLASVDVLEVNTVTIHVEPELQVEVEQLQDDVKRIDAQLEHAVFDLPDAVVHVLENEVTVTEQTTPVEVATDYNDQLAGASNTTQTVFRENAPNTPGSGILNSDAFDKNSGTDRQRRKLLYIPEGTTYVNQTYVTAFDGSTARDLIDYANGAFRAKVFVPAVPAGSTSTTVYPSPPNRVSGAGIWQNVPALTFVDGIPVPEADELFFTRDIPSSAVTLNIQYRGHANSNVFGTNSTTLANVGSSSETATTFVLDDGSEQATVEVRYYPNFQGRGRAIRVSVTERVNTGLPTINDVEVILSYTETRTIPARPATVRNVEIERVHSGYQVFAFKPSPTNTLIIVGDTTEIDTQYPYTTLFGASETGFLTVTSETATFLDFEDFNPIPSTITDLENHASLPKLGLFTTQYNEETTVEMDVSLQVPRLNVSNIPTSAAGLSSGDIWNDAGTLKIIT